MHNKAEFRGRVFRKRLLWWRLLRAIAVDPESATVAADGLRFRVPFGRL